MLHQVFVTQPAGGINYLTLFQEAFGNATIKRCDAAVAYVTRSGVLALDKACREYSPKGWPRMKKRWLVGIDYCRTEPVALEMLLAFPNSDVRVHAGIEVVARKLCTPVLPFHPKTYILHGPKNTIGAICGSGNLSGNGLTKGHEVGNLMITANPMSAEERVIQGICRHLNAWFINSWKNATLIKSVFKAYQAVYEAADHLRAPTPTDDDSSDTRTLEIAPCNRHALGPDDLRKLRACKSLWIEAGNLHHNRGKDASGQWKPGNQLMLTRMTRVFFGFPARDLPTDSAVGDITISFRNRTRPDCSLRFSNNSMDVLTLPVPGDGGPAKYDQENLLFRKEKGGGFVLSIGDARKKRIWIRKSKAIDGYHRMTSGRQWGVF